MEEVPELKDKVFEIISEMIQSMGYIDQPLKLNDMWFNRYDDNRPILEYHYHQNCSWTGTYYPVDANHTTVLYNPLAKDRAITLSKSRTTICHIIKN